MARQKKQVSNPPRLPVHPSWVYEGPPGHFCDAKKCVFHLHTHVRRGEFVYCVNTVGEYYPRLGERPFELMAPEYLGADERTYETMVFVYDQKWESHDGNDLLCWGAKDRDGASFNHALACWLWATTDTTASALIEQAQEGDRDAIAPLLDRLMELELITM